MEAQVKIASCDFCYTKNKEYKPKILDMGDQFVLSNLPQPWILLCEKSQKPFVIPYSTYHIVNHTNSASVPSQLLTIIKLTKHKLNVMTRVSKTQNLSRILLIIKLL